MHALVCALLVCALLGVHHANCNDILTNSDDSVGKRPLESTEIDAGARTQHAWGRPSLGTGPLLGQALQHAWDKPALGTGPSTCLGHARSWDMLFQ